MIWENLQKRFQLRQIYPKAANTWLFTSLKKKKKFYAYFVWHILIFYISLSFSLFYTHNSSPYPSVNYFLSFWFPFSLWLTPPSKNALFIQDGVCCSLLYVQPFFHPLYISFVNISHSYNSFESCWISDTPLISRNNKPITAKVKNMFKWISS